MRFTCTVSSIVIQWEVPDLGISALLAPGNLGVPVVEDPFVVNFISIDTGPPVQSVSSATVTVTAMLNGIEIQCTDGSVVNGESDNTTILVLGKQL